MATNTYVALDTRTVSADVASVDFTNISGAYTDLVVVASVRGATHLYARVGNGTLDTANYSVTGIYGRDVSGSGQSGAERYSNQAYLRMTPFTYVPSATSTSGTVVMNFQNYSNTTTRKSILVRSAGVGASNYGGTELSSLLWNSTSAINAISFYIQSGNILAGSTFTIYGVANADKFNKANGGVISEDSTYVYHTFGSTGTFTPKEALTADILVIAGGGGGGNFGGGGGGAGGLLAHTSQSLTATSYTVTVGSGGAGGAANSALYGTAGGNSQFGALTASVGGGRGGGRATSSPGTTGGSGGGNAYSLGSLAGTSGQGYAGGAGTAGGGGGGGGAGEAGNTDAVQGSGGDGVSTYSSWYPVTLFGENVGGSYYLAGGGGGWGDNAIGGIGGDGGGGTGTSSTSVRRDGLVSTGSGGGATSQSIAGGNGGSGVVIVRYAK